MLRPLITLLSLALLLTLRGTPTAYVPVPRTPTAADRIDVAVGYLQKRGIDLTGYTARQVMVEQAAGALYLQTEIGPQAVVERLKTEDLPLFYWQVHLSQPGSTRQYWVRVTIRGEVGAFVTRLPETASGARPTLDQARRMARAVLPSRPNAWEEVDTQSQVLPSRTDHKFVFKRNLKGLDKAEERVTVAILGGQLGSFRTWIKVPETFDERQSAEDTYADALFWTAIFFDVVLILLAIGLLVRAYLIPKAGEASGPAAAGVTFDPTDPTALRAALLVYGVLLLTVFNYIPITLASDYSPIRPLWAFLLSNSLYLALYSAVPAIATYLMLSAGQVADSTAVRSGERSRLESFRRLMAGKLGDPLVRSSMATGLAMGAALGGGEALFYHFGQNYGSVRLPVGVMYVNTMGTVLPFMYPLSIGIAAAITEEASFRLFAVTYLRQLGLGRFLSVLFPAMAWAFGHSHEAVYPVWVRGVELVVGGLMIGYFFLESDVLSVMTAHYMYDVVTFGWPLLVSKDPLTVAGAVFVVALAVIPGLLGLLDRFRQGVPVQPGT